MQTDRTSPDSARETFAVVLKALGCREILNGAVRLPYELARARQSSSLDGIGYGGISLVGGLIMLLATESVVSIRLPDQQARPQSAPLRRSVDLTPAGRSAAARRERPAPSRGGSAAADRSAGPAPAGRPTMPHHRGLAGRIAGESPSPDRPTDASGFRSAAPGRRNRTDRLRFLERRSRPARGADGRAIRPARLRSGPREPLQRFDRQFHVVLAIAAAGRQGAATSEVGSPTANSGQRRTSVSNRWASVEGGVKRSVAVMCRPSGVTAFQLFWAGGMVESSWPASVRASTTSGPLA